MDVTSKASGSLHWGEWSRNADLNDGQLEYLHQQFKE